MQVGDRTGVEHTLNIWFMVVTLDVSKASGWLNADALCRESNGGHAVRGEGVRASRRGQQCPACSGGSTGDWGQNRRGAHHEHVAHVRDAGRVEGQRLVERRRQRGLPRAERRAYGAQGEGAGQ